MLKLYIGFVRLYLNEPERTLAWAALPKAQHEVHLMKCI